MLVLNSPFRQFDAFFDQGLGHTNTASAGHSAPTDAYRRGDDVWVHVDLPGVAADSLDVSVERNVLTITGARIWERQEGDRVYLTERRSGSFRRQVTLGDGLDASRIEADYTDGVLTLRVPVAEQAQPRKIAIGSRIADAVVTTTGTD